MPKMLFDSLDGKTYTMRDLKKNKARLVYWIVFAQDIITYSKTSTGYGHMLTAYTFKQAKKLAKKYHAILIQRMIQSDLGRWCIKEFYTSPEDVGLSDTELWDKYEHLPAIEFGLKYKPLVLEI